jgi:hypothetical protein
MASRQSKTTTEVTAPTADAYRAFADFLGAGNTASFEDWYASDAGKTAILAFQDQANAAKRAERMAANKTVWRDLKAFGTVASDKGIAAAIAHRDYLVSLDLENLKPTEEAPVSTRKRGGAAATATTDAENDDDE